MKGNSDARRLQSVVGATILRRHECTALVLFYRSSDRNQRRMGGHPIDVSEANGGVTPKPGETQIITGEIAMPYGLLSLVIILAIGYVIGARWPSLAQQAGVA